MKFFRPGTSLFERFQIFDPEKSVKQFEFMGMSFYENPTVKKGECFVMGKDNQILGHVINLGEDVKKSLWLSPEPSDLESPEFEAIWQCIKSWDINVPEVYVGYCGATGNHVMAILRALREARLPFGDSEEGMDG